MANRHLTDSMIDYVFLLKNFAAFSLFMILAVVGFQHVFSTLVNEIFLLVGSVVVGAVVYIALIWIFDRKRVKELRKLMKSGAINA